MESVHEDEHFQTQYFDLIEQKKVDENSSIAIVYYISKLQNT